MSEGKREDDWYLREVVAGDNNDFHFHGFRVMYGLIL
jgi:hypothetical protein